jgi:hypothetical protein
MRQSLLRGGYEAGRGTGYTRCRPEGLRYKRPEGLRDKSLKTRAVVAEIGVSLNLQSSICNRQFPMQFIYTMKGLGKIHQPDHASPSRHLAVVPIRRQDRRARHERRRQELAAEDHGGRGPHFIGEAFPAAGIKVGFLQQEPQLDRAKTCAATSRKACRPFATC